VARPDIDALFGALADPTRRSLLDKLSREGPATATQLASAYPVTRQAVVKHLSALADAGLLHPQRDGREVQYSVQPAQLDEAAAWLASVGARWDQRLDALQRHLRKE